MDEIIAKLKAFCERGLKSLKAFAARHYKLLLAVAYALLIVWKPFIAATILMLMLIVLVHEYGHYFFLRRDRISVKKFCVGFGKDEWAIWSRKLKDGTLFMIKPIFAGGYVLPDEEAVVAARPWSKLKYFAGGMLFNTVSAFVILAVILYAKGVVLDFVAISDNPLFRLFTDFTFAVPPWLRPLVCAFCFTFGMWLGGPFLIGWMFLFMGTQGVGGPVAIIGAGTPPPAFQASFVAILIHYVFFYINISVAVASFNFLPFYPLDGGHMLELGLTKLCGAKAPVVVKWFRLVSVIVFFGLIFLALGNDFTNLFSGKSATVASLFGS